MFHEIPASARAAAAAELARVVKPGGVVVGPQPEKTEEAGSTGVTLSDRGCGCGNCD